LELLDQLTQQDYIVWTIYGPAGGLEPGEVGSAVVDHRDVETLLTFGLITIAGLRESYAFDYRPVW